MRVTGRLLPFSFILIALVSALVPATASPVAYSSPAGVRDLKACILDLAGQDNPLVFVSLMNAPFCPEGWSFSNPLAPVELDAGITYRGLPNGTPILKTWPVYWVVPRAGVRRVMGMDFIYVPVSGALNTTRNEEDALISVVENGALLWVDYAGGSVTRFQPPRTYPTGGGNPVPFNFGNIGTVADHVACNYNSDLFNIPFKLSQREISTVGSGNVGVIWPNAGQVMDVAFEPLLEAMNAAGAHLGYSAMMMPYGGGAILVTSGNVGAEVANWVRVARSAPAGNSPSIKFIYNALARLFQYRQQASNGGRAAVSLSRSPVQIKWQFPAADRAAPGGGAIDFGPVMGAPMVYNGRVYVAAGRGSGAAQLVCLDADPECDLDNDGNKDDGIVDYSIGSDYDVVWTYSFDAQQSPKSASVSVGNLIDTSTSPYGITPVVVCATSPISSSGGAAGNVYCFNAGTGALVWATSLPSYNGGTAGVCDVSTPIIHNGWVYAAVSEYDSTLSDSTGANLDRTYGRVWCLDLATGGNLANNGAQWVYPDRDLDRDGNVQEGASLPANPTEAGENQRSLPCFNDPVWVAAVGTGSATEMPALHTAAPIATSNANLQTATNNPTVLDALVVVRTPISFVWNQTNGAYETSEWNGVLDRGGGSEIALVPTPLDQALMPRINLDYYRVRLNAAATAIDAARRAGDPAGNEPPLMVPTGTSLARFESVDVATNGGVRQFLANWSATAANSDDRLALQAGCDIEVHNSAWSTAWQTYQIPGPVRWMRPYPHNQQPAGSALSQRNLAIGATIPPINWANPPVTATLGAVEPSGRIGGFELDSGALRWQIDPRAAFPRTTAGIGGQESQGMTLSGVAGDADTLTVATTLWPLGGGAQAPQTSLSALMGLRQNVDYQVHLGPGVADTVRVRAIAAGTGTPADPTDDSPTRVWLLEQFSALNSPQGCLRASAYQVDRLARVLRVPAIAAHNVPLMTDMTISADTVAGKAVVTQWADDTTPNPTWREELHVFPPAHDFVYASGFVKLNHYPVVWAPGGAAASPLVMLPDDTPDLSDNPRVLGVVAGEPTVALTLNGVSYNALLPNGWLDMRSAYVDVNGNGSYDAGTDISALGLEVIVSYTGFHEPSISWVRPSNLPAVYQPDVNGFVRIPNPGLSLSIDRHQVPVEFGLSRATPTVAGRTLFLGTDGFDPDFSNSFVAPGGAASVRDTLLALNWDPVTGGTSGQLVQPAWTNAADVVPIVRAPVTVVGDTAYVASSATDAPDRAPTEGYVSAMATERTVIAAGSRAIECVGSKPARTLVGYVTTSGQVRTFGHLAKCTRLDNGDYLVVDSGLSQVMELDQDGNIQWSAGAGSGAKLLLDRPTDAWRYETNDGVTRIRHTVVADAGYKRIVEFVTVVSTAPWTSGTNYTLGSLAMVGTTCYRCTEPHSAGAANQPAGAGNWALYWSVATDEAYVVSPSAVPTGEPGQFVQLEYQTAQPILDPQNGELWGYLASASNWRTPLIVEPPHWDAAGNYYPASIQPTGPVWGATIGIIGTPAFAAGARVWNAWTALYNKQFTNIRQVGYVNYGNALFGTSTPADTFVWVVASSYTPLPAAPMGLYEFELTGGTLSHGFTRAEYVASGQGTITLPGGQVFTKAFFPTCAQRLPDGSYLIANYAGAVPNLTKNNLNALSFDQVLGSEVFREYNGTVWVGDRLPDPRQPSWPEPISLISSVQRP